MSCAHSLLPRTRGLGLGWRVVSKEVEGIFLLWHLCKCRGSCRFNVCTPSVFQTSRIWWERPLERYDESMWVQLNLALRSSSALPLCALPFTTLHTQTTTRPKRTLARSRLCPWKSRLLVGACSCTEMRVLFLYCACLYWLILCIKSQRKHAGVTQCNTDKTDCQVFWRKSRTAWVIDYICSGPSKQTENTILVYLSSPIFCSKIRVQADIAHFSKESCISLDGSRNEI